MKKSLVSGAAAILVVMSLTGCGVNTSEKVHATSIKQLKSMIRKNHTTKEQVKDIFGEPGIVEDIGHGRERWTYIDDGAKDFNPASLIPVAGMFAENKTTTESIIFAFNKNNTVRSFRKTRTESKSRAVDFIAGGTAKIKTKEY